MHCNPYWAGDSKAAYKWLAQAEEEAACSIDLALQASEEKLPSSYSQ
jgi:hypothetical protein